jgi:hypothetical protein
MTKINAATPHPVGTGGESLHNPSSTSSLYKLYDREGSIRDEELFTGETLKVGSSIEIKGRKLRVAAFIWGPIESGNNRKPSGVILVEPV